MRTGKSFFIKEDNFMNYAMFFQRTVGLIFLLSLLTQILIGQETDGEHSDRLRKGSEILKLAKDVVYRNVEKRKIDSIRLEKSVTKATDLRFIYENKTKSHNSKIRNKSDTEILLNFPDHIKSSTTTYISENNPNENFSKLNLVSNGRSVGVDQLFVFNGRIFDIDEIALRSGASEETKKAEKDARKKMETQEFVRQSLWFDIFPMMLELPWEAKTKFVYLGKAVSGKTRANILEYVPSKEEESKFKEKTTVSRMRFFFDEKTHLLLLVTADISSEKIESKTKYFFSDYQTLDGLLVARRIKSETIALVKKQAERVGEKVISIESKTVSETTIKKLEVNPKFKRGAFQIKRKTTQGK